MPLGWLVMVLVTPVWVLVAVIWTSGTTAPVLSVTMPLTLAYTSSAKRDGVANSNNIASASIPLVNRVMSRLLRSFFVGISLKTDWGFSNKCP